MAERDYVIVGPDGRELTITGPDDATPQQLRAAAERAFAPSAGAVRRAAAPAPAPETAAPRMGDLPVVQGLFGAIRGAGGIGSTLLELARSGGTYGQPFATLPARIGERSAAVEGGLQSLGADPSSGGYLGGRLAGEVAGTLGVGPALAGGLRMMPHAGRAEPALAAIESAGMRTGLQASGALQWLGNLGLRVGGGAATGGAATALVSPQDAGTGAAIGAAAPPALGALGKGGELAGRAYRAVRPGPAQAGEELARALGALTPQQLRETVAALRAAPTLVPGAAPTLAQAVPTPQAAILERVLSAGPGGEALRNRIIAQGEARLAALEGVAPTHTGGRAQAREDLGVTLARQMIPAEAAESQRVSGLFDSVDPQDATRMFLPLEQMQAARSQYLGPGTFGTGRAATEALRAAEDIGTVQLPAAQLLAQGRDLTLLQAVKKAGGIDRSSISAGMVRGELGDLREFNLGRFARARGGVPLDRMAERMFESGYLPDDDPVTLLNALREAPHQHAAGQGGGAMRRAADEAMGALPGAERAPRTVPFRQVQNLRSSLGEAAEQSAARGATKEAAALRRMIGEIDARVNEVVRGDWRAGENFPLEWANRWTEALKAHQAKMQRFHTGPQASMFRKGPGGEPAIQGGEIAARFWGQRPGLADDVRAFRRLVDDDPQLLGQFRSLVTTDAPVGASGELGARFVRWVENTLPGLRETFAPAQVATLQRIAEDVQRAGAAARRGSTIGGNSSTYQNVSHALDAGLLSSPAAQYLARALTYRGLGLEPVRMSLAESTRRARAGRLAELMADPAQAGSALDALLAQWSSGAAPPGALSLLAGRSAPILGASPR